MARRSRTQPRKLPRQSRAKATVAAILDAAARILVKDGYEGASVNRIAEVAGVSIGSLYQYYPSREALVAAVVARHNQRMIAVFQQELTALAHLPIRQAVRGLVVRAIEALTVELELHRVIEDQVPKTGILQRTHEFYEVLAFILGGYLEFHRSEVRPVDIQLAVAILVPSVEAAINGLALVGKDLKSTAIVDELVALVEGYLAPISRLPP
jgi:AcrR family transcriptional regulator